MAMKKENLEVHRGVPAKSSPPSLSLKENREKSGGGGGDAAATTTGHLWPALSTEPFDIRLNSSVGEYREWSHAEYIKKYQRKRHSKMVQRDCQEALKLISEETLKRLRPHMPWQPYLTGEKKLPFKTFKEMNLREAFQWYLNMDKLIDYASDC
eukprot:jgi/Bigna1/84459/fgenesh1_pg.139_\